MQSLALAMKTKGSEGESLPDVFPQLAQLGVHFRRSQVSLIVGAPGGGKSAVVSHIAKNITYDEHLDDRVPVLYFSADTDRGTMGVRFAAAILNVDINDAEQMLDEGDEKAWSAVSNAMSHVWWSWDSAPTLLDIEKEIEAYVDVTGEYPHLIIVDNLKNLVPEAEGQRHEEFDQIMEWLKVLANITGAHVCVLHHVTGMYEDGGTKIPLSGVMGKCAKPCALVLTLHMVTRDPDILGMSIVKNRSGKADGSGNLYAEVPWIPSRSWFGTGG